MRPLARTIITFGTALNFVSVLSVPADTFYAIDSIISATAATDFYPANQLISGPGVDFQAAPPHESINQNSGTLWVTTACGFPCDYFLTLPVPELTIDLGTDRALNEISVWGYTDSNSNGAKKATLRFATSSEGTNNFADSISFTPSFSLQNNGLNRQSFAFGQTVTARYVQVQLTDNHFLPPGGGSAGELPGGDRVGLGEIAFAIPETDDDEILVSAPNDFTLKAGEIDSSFLNTLFVNTNYWAVERSTKTGDLYLSVPTDGRILKVDNSTTPPQVTPFVDSPGAVFHGLAINEEDGYLYAADSASDTILRYDLATGAANSSVGSGFTRPNEIIFDPSTDRLIVSDSGTDAIYVFNKLGILQTTIDDGTTEGAWGLVIDPQNGDLLYSSHDQGEIYRRSLSGGAATVEHTNLEGPRGLTYDRWGRLYCVEATANRVTTFGPSAAIYSTAPGGRDISIMGLYDFDGDFLPDDWENTSGGLALTFTGDLDGDGLVNGIEAATGGSTSTTDGNPISTELTDDGEFIVSHNALKKSSLRYTLWLSSDLNNWRPASTLPTRTAGASDYESWLYRISPEDEGFPGDLPELFTRLSLEPAF